MGDTFHLHAFQIFRISDKYPAARCEHEDILSCHHLLGCKVCLLMHMLGLNARTGTHIYTYTCMRTHKHTYTCTNTHIHTHIHTYTYIHRHTHIHTQTHTYIYIYIDIYRYIQNQPRMTYEAVYRREPAARYQPECRARRAARRLISGCRRASMHGRVRHPRLVVYLLYLRPFKSIYLR